jgi:CubicO group peptidase (beta-lactamase class C family)
MIPVARRCVALTFLAAFGTVSAQTAADSHVNHRARIEAATWPLGFPGPDQRQLKLLEWMQLFHVPGLSIAVIDDFKIAWTAQYGVADMASRRPVDESTLFQAASISKSVNAFGQLRLVDEGKLSLDEPVDRWLKSWTIPENEFTRQAPVTLREILSHTAGFTVHGFDGYQRGAPLPSVRQILNGAPPANTPPVTVAFAPGTKFEYSGGGILVSQLLLTDVTGASYAGWMLRNVLKPIGMKSSTFDNPPSGNLLARTATGYRGDAAEVEGGGWFLYPEMAAAGLWTTPRDLATFGIEVMRALRGESSLLSRNAAEQMLTEQKDGSALGFMVRSASGEFGHTGSDDGFRAMLVCFRDGRGAVVMSNSDLGTYVEQRVLAAIAREYHWNYADGSGQSFADVVFTLTMHDGARSALEITRRAMADPKPSLPHGKRVALNAAYGLFDARRWNDVLMLLDYQLELTPNDDNVYELQSRALDALGRHDEALRAVKHALELNPKNENAQTQLRRLDKSARSGGLR